MTFSNTGRKVGYVVRTGIRGLPSTFCVDAMGGSRRCGCCGKIVGGAGPVVSEEMQLA